VRPHPGLLSGLRSGLLAAAALAIACPACQDKTSSAYIADEFADAYFRRMDQDAALKFTALGATEMLDKEIEATKALRESGYTPAEAASAVSFVRGPAVPRDARVDFHYHMTIRAGDGPPSTQDADVELARIGGGWKVVSVHITR